MAGLAEQRCFHHVEREAAARCPECRRFFCRECVTEHEGVIFCASCLADASGGDTKSKRRVSLVRGVLLIGSCAVLWCSFFALGRMLLVLPDTFHDGTVWSAPSPFELDEDE